MPFKKTPPLYCCWANMLSRCRNPNTPSFRYYGGRGIKVCKRWTTGVGAMTGYECFAADVGPRPFRGATIERVDNNRGYRPANVRWTTRTEQQFNRRGAVVVLYRGRRYALNGAVGKAAADTGLGHKTIQGRVYTLRKKGVGAQAAFDDAIQLPLRQGFRSDLT